MPPTRPAVARTGKVAGAGDRAQHVDLHRKLGLRKGLLTQALPGPVFLPFCGDGDIAAECYQGRMLYGADLDPARVATCSARFPSSNIRVADCDTWPFDDITEPFAVADLDAYSNPYLALGAFWTHAAKLPRVVIFETDGLRMRIVISRMKVTKQLPSGAEQPATINEARAQYNTWWARTALPHIQRQVAPYRVATSRMYLRAGMIYWGVVVQQ